MKTTRTILPVLLALGAAAAIAPRIAGIPRAASSNWTTPPCSVGQGDAPLDDAGPYQRGIWRRSSQTSRAER